MKRGHLVKKYLENQRIALEVLMGCGHDFLEENDIWQILQIEFDLDDLDYCTLFFRELTVEEIVVLVQAFLIKKGRPLGSISVELSEDVVIQIADSNELFKAIVRSDGRKWIIHKYDADPFPSSPHAHDYKNNIVLCFRCGKLYNKKRKAVGQMRRKDFESLRQRIKLNYPRIVLPEAIY